MGAAASCKLSTAEKGLGIVWHFLCSYARHQLKLPGFLELLSGTVQYPAASLNGTSVFGADGTLGPESARQLQALYDDLLRQKTATKSLSKISFSTWHTVVEKAKLTLKATDLPACSSSKNTDAFGWDDSCELSQSDRWDNNT